MTRLRAFLAYFLLSLTLALGLLLRHRIPPGYQGRHCAENVSFLGRFTVVLNCDSHEFMRLALEPYELLEPTNVRQSRPGMVFLASVLARLLEPLVASGTEMFQGAGVPLPSRLRELGSAYLAYIMLNFLTLWTTAYLFLVQVGGTRIEVGAVALGGLLIVNRLAKTFLLTPHTALLVLLASTLCLWLLREFAKPDPSRRLRGYLVLAATGIAVTAYAGFVVALPCAFIGALRRPGAGNLRQRWIGLLGGAVLASVLVLAPLAIWIAYVRIQTGGFYSHEIEAYGQVVWFFRGVRSDLLTTWGRFGSNVVALGAMALRQLAPAVVLGLLLVACAVGGISRRSPSRETVEQVGGQGEDVPSRRGSAQGPAGLRLMNLGDRTEVLWDSVLVSTLFLLFFGLVGLLAERVAYGAVASIIVGLAAWVEGVLESVPVRRRRMAGVVGLSFLVLELVRLLATVGPFS